LKKNLEIKNAGFYVCNKDFFQKYTRGRNVDDVQYLKEWEITAQARNIELDENQVEGFEQRYFDDRSIWKSFYNDRRIFMGRYCKVTQDYRSPYSYDEMVRIFQVAVLEIEKFLDSVHPDIVVACNAPTTFGEYLLHRIIKKRCIPRLILRPTKVKNNCTFTDDYLGNSFVHRDYQLFLDADSSKSNPYYENAKEYIDSFREKGRMIYEGSVGFTLKLRGVNPIDLGKALVRDIRNLGKEKDNHNNVLWVKNFYYDRILRYVRFRYQSLRLGGNYVGMDDVKRSRYIFFPLHAEPEIATTLFSDQTNNQIELIRNIAMQLPAKYKLLVKEHPRCIGRRKIGYYKKLFEIPNVDIAKPFIRPIRIMRESELMIAISGFAGLEAVFNCKPVITLGSVPYNMLPRCMVNHVKKVNTLYHEIRWSLENYQYDEQALIAYISANFKNSVSIYLYSVLLGKKRSMAVERTEEKYRTDIENLTKYLSEMIKKSIAMPLTGYSYTR
jgi:hypothetical protein